MPKIDLEDYEHKRRRKSIKPSWLRYSQEEVDRYRNLGFVKNGVVYDMFIDSPDGAEYHLIDEGQPTKQIQQARAMILQDYDVVGAVRLARIEEE